MRAHGTPRARPKPVGRPVAGVAIGLALAAALAGAACGGAGTQGGAAGGGPRARLPSLHWMVSREAVQKLAEAGTSEVELRRWFDNPDTFLLGAGSTPATAGWSAAQRTLIFPSLAAMENGLEAPSRLAGTRAVVYDNESWSLTPPPEQRDPAGSEARAASLAHAQHLLLISTPATDLARVLAPGETSPYDAYLRLGLAASAARAADVVDIQAQGSEANTAAFAAFVRSAAAQARSANPGVVVLAGISTNPSGQQVSASQVTAAVRATLGIVDGYWLNIPSGGVSCPRCGTAQPQVAAETLSALARRRS